MMLFLTSVASAYAAEILDANSATRDELVALVQLNDAIVEEIVKNRPFESIRELDDLLSRAFDAESREALYGRLFVPLKLNSAPEDEIRLIPGVGRKMAHEFEEYRPYTSIEQFRREIGKYVDAKEVARLEQYVTLK
jgi:DNA uptake protein ComE-like DNA-binding protein